MIDITVEERGPITVIFFSGTLNIQSLKKAEATWYDAIKKGPEVLAMNLNKLVFIDSSAIGAMVKLLNLALSKKVKIILYDISESIRQVFETVRLGKFFTIMTAAEFEAAYRKKN